MDTQEEVTERVRIIFEDLKSKGKVKFKNYFLGPLGIKPSYVTQIMKGEKGYFLPKDRYDQFCELWGVNKDYLLYGEQPMYVKESENHVKQNINPSVYSNARLIAEIFPGEEETQFRDLGDGKLLMLVPKVDKFTMAGYLEHIQDREWVQELPIENIIVDRHHRGRYLAFEVIGDSMTNGTEDSIPNGCTVIGREIKMDLWRSRFHTHTWDDYVIVHQDGIIVKRITGQDIEKGTIRVASLNEDKGRFPDSELSLNDIIEIYNVIEVRIKRRK